MAPRPTPRLDLLSKRLLWAVGLAAFAMGVGLDRLPGATPGFGVGQAGLLGVALAAAIAALALSSRARITLLLGTASVVVALAMLEAGLRWRFAPEWEPLFRPHDEWIYELIPDRTTLRRLPPEAGGEVYSFVVNADGFRGSELRPKADRRRVVVYGDSYVMGEFSREEETFARRLQVDLDGASTRAVEVINAGVAGHGPDQYALRMRRQVFRLAPDLVIVAIFSGNDFGDLIQNQLARLGSTGELEWNAAGLSAHARRAMLRAPIEPYLWKARRLLDRLRPVEPLALDRFATWLEIAEQRWQSYRIGTHIVDATRDGYNANLALHPTGASAQFSVRLMRAVLTDVASWAESLDLPIAVVVIPSGIDVCDEYFLGQVDATRYPDYRREGLGRLVVEAAEAAPMPVFDLFPPFRENEPERLYFRSHDRHWNARGQALAARRVAAWIVDNRWFSRSNLAADPSNEDAPVALSS